MMREILNKIYYDISHPAGYSSVQKLYTAAKKELPSLTLNDVRKWLKHQNTYTQHKKVRKNFRRRKTLARGIDDVWQMDLCDLSKLSTYNRGYKFLLTVIDVFSRYAFVRPLKNKTGLEVSKAIDHIFQTEKRKSKSVGTDFGTEFYNRNVQALLDKHHIKLYSVVSEPKMALVERFNRTLKSRMWRYFTRHNTRNYIDVLPKLVSSYNNTKHRIIGISPSQVNSENEKMIWQKLYRKEFVKPVRFKYDIGDYVKLSKKKNIFEKGYVPNWTLETFIVKERRATNPVTYKITNLKGEEVIGSFYEEQMQLVNKPKPDISKQIEVLKKDGNGRYYIHYKDWSSRFDEWIDKDKLITI